MTLGIGHGTRAGMWHREGARRWEGSGTGAGTQCWDRDMAPGLGYGTGRGHGTEDGHCTRRGFGGRPLNWSRVGAWDLTGSSPSRR